MNTIPDNYAENIAMIHPGDFSEYNAITYIPNYAPCADKNYPNKLAERIAYNWYYSKFGHRDNVLNPEHTEMGIGISIGMNPPTYNTEHYGEAPDSEYEHELVFYAVQKFN